MPKKEIPNKEEEAYRRWLSHYLFSIPLFFTPFVSLSIHPRRYACKDQRLPL
jgi:hypothetical protein